MRVFEIEREPPQHLFSLMSEWEIYLRTVGELTENRANHQTVQKCIDVVCAQIQTFPIPDEQCLLIAERVVKPMEDVIMSFHSKAYIPLAGVTIKSPLQTVPLARATLCRGFKKSELATHIDRIPEHISFEVPIDTAYLVIDVTGDDENVAAQVQTELENALKVLRYVAWTATTIQGNERISYNQAAHVTQFPEPYQPYFYISRDGRTLTRNLHQRRFFAISPQTVEQFRMFGLDSINCHFAHPTNPISGHILLALDWYDSGLQAYRNRDALYRFVVCLNCILSWCDSDGISFYKELMRRLKKLMAHFMTEQDEEITHDFFGEFDFQSIDGKDVSKKTIPEIIDMLAGHYAEVFKPLYSNQRGMILHGLPENPGQPLTKNDIKNAQLLAHNAIRLLMKLISQNPDWDSKQDVEDWFASS